MTSNSDFATVSGFGREWAAFDQSALTSEEIDHIQKKYFSIFPWANLPLGGGVGADFGCGSGRWARVVAPKVEHLHVVDASAEALAVAKANLKTQNNVSFHCESIENAPLAAQSLDFAFSLGVLHHVPDTLRAIKDIAKTLKPGAPFLTYLYYSFDNQPFWYRQLWWCSDILRKLISRLPFLLRWLCSQFIALVGYWPLARLALALDFLGIMPDSFPLSFYRNLSFYVMRTDALDRFGTRLERRFSRDQISQMLQAAGFERIRFSEKAPYWCAVAFRSVENVS